MGKLLDLFDNLHQGDDPATETYDINDKSPDDESRVRQQRVPYDKNDINDKSVKSNTYKGSPVTQSTTKALPATGVTDFCRNPNSPKSLKNQLCRLSRLCRNPHALTDAIEALERRRPDHIGTAPWQHAVEDGRRFVVQWGEQAATLGWTADHIFALPPVPANPHPSWQRLARVDLLGLAWMLHGRPVTAVTAEAITIEMPGGNLLKFYRSPPSAADNGDNSAAKGATPLPISTPLTADTLDTVDTLPAAQAHQGASAENSAPPLHPMQPMAPAQHGGIAFLRALGYTDTAIANIRPQEEHAILNGSP